MSSSTDLALTPSPIGEVRYSLLQLLSELKAERAAAAFAMEKLDQGEILKILKAKKVRRAKK